MRVPQLEALPEHILMAFLDNVGVACHLVENRQHAEAARRLEFCLNISAEAADAGRPWGAEAALCYHQALERLSAER